MFVEQSTEFDIEREYVGRIVGAQGSGINKLRDQLGVKVDVSDDVDEKEKEVGKKKKALHQKSKVKVRISYCEVLYLLFTVIDRLLAVRKMSRRLKGEFKRSWRGWFVFPLLLPYHC